MVSSPNRPKSPSTPTNAAHPSAPLLRARRGPVVGTSAPLFNLNNALGFEVSLTEACNSGRGALVVFLGEGGDGRRDATLRSLEATAGRLRAADIALLAIGVVTSAESLALTTSGRLTFDVLCDKDSLVHDGYRLDADDLDRDLTIFALDRDHTVCMALESQTGADISKTTIDALIDSLDATDLPTA